MNTTETAPRSKVIYVRMTEAEHATVAEKAAACGQSISEWARENLVYAAGDEGGDDE